MGGTRKCCTKWGDSREKLRVRFLWIPPTDHCITLIPWYFYLICPYLVNIVYLFTLNSWSGGQSPYLNEVCLATCLWKACHNVLLLETLDCSSRSPTNSTELNKVSLLTEHEMTAVWYKTWNKKADFTGDVLLAAQIFCHSAFVYKYSQQCHKSWLWDYKSIPVIRWLCKYRIFNQDFILMCICKHMVLSFVT